MTRKGFVLNWGTSYSLSASRKNTWSVFFCANKKIILKIVHLEWQDNQIRQKKNQAKRYRKEEHFPWYKNISGC